MVGGAALAGMPAHDFVDPEAGERSTRARDENRGLRPIAHRRHEFTEQRRALLPQRADTPFVAFPMQVDTRFRTEVEIADTQLGDLLHPSAGVVEKQQQRAIAQGPRLIRSNSHFDSNFTVASQNQDSAMLKVEKSTEILVKEDVSSHQIAQN